MNILRLLDQSKVIDFYEVLDYPSFDGGIYYKIEVVFNNQSTLHIREYIDKNERNDAYHFQDKNNQLITRWDNTPHHKHIATYPHHRHINDTVIESFEITLDEILEVIEENYF